MGIPRRAVGAVVLVAAVAACGGDGSATVVAGQAAPDPQASSEAASAEATATATASATASASARTAAATVDVALDCGGGLVATASYLHPDASTLPAGERPLEVAVAESVRQSFEADTVANGIEGLGGSYEVEARTAGEQAEATVIEAGELAVSTVVTDDLSAPGAWSAVVVVHEEGAVIGRLHLAELAPDHWVTTSASACAEVPE